MDKINLTMKLHGVTKVFNESGIEDESLIKATFLILELDTLSGNNQVITEEEGLKMASTMKLKPLTCQYNPTLDYVNQDDSFIGHGMYKEKFRKTGEEFIASKAFAIGVSKEGCYAKTITKEDGTEVKCLFADFYLWWDRYPNVISLINDIWESGLTLYSSCEYTYSAKNSTIIDGVQYPKDLTFLGHCILCSGENGSQAITPAFKESKLTSFNEKLEVAINEVIINSMEGGIKLEENKEKVEGEVVGNSTEENNNTEETKIVGNEGLEDQTENQVEDDKKVVVNELSQEDIRTQLRKQVVEKLGCDTYDIWICGDMVYDTHFTYELWNPTEEKYQYFTVNYTRQGDVITVDMDNVKEVERRTVWVTVNEAEVMVNEKQTTIDTLTAEKEDLQTKFNDASEKVVTLNSELENLKPKAEKYDEYVFNEKLEEQQTYYKEKFVGLNSLDKYNSKEVQDLIVNSITNIDSKTMLNEMLINLVPTVSVEKVDKKVVVNEMVSKTENLLPKKIMSFEDRYDF